MKFDDIQALCLSFRGSTVNVQWGDALVFKVAGKMFAVAHLEPDAKSQIAFKCSDERFAELIEQEGVIPAPYLARAKWVAVERFDTLPRGELSGLLRESYAMAVAKFTKKEREGLEEKPVVKVKVGLTRTPWA